MRFGDARNRMEGPRGTGRFCMPRQPRFDCLIPPLQNPQSRHDLLQDDLGRVRTLQNLKNVIKLSPKLNLPNRPHLVIGKRCNWTTLAIRWIFLVFSDNYPVLEKQLRLHKLLRVCGVHIASRGLGEEIDNVEEGARDDGHQNWQNAGTYLLTFSSLPEWRQNSSRKLPSCKRWLRCALCFFLSKMNFTNFFRYQSLLPVTQEISDDKIFVTISHHPHFI